MWYVIILKICIAVYSLPDILKILLSHEKAEYVLTERFNQDSLENYFGKQRARGHRNDNPSVAQYMDNAQALIVQKSMASGGSSNITKTKRAIELSAVCMPLPKHKCIRPA